MRSGKENKSLMPLPNTTRRPACRPALLSRRLILCLTLLLFCTAGCEGPQEKVTEAPLEEAPTAATNTYMIESVFDQVLRKTQANPEDADAWYHLADLFSRANEYEKAVDAYRRTVELDPEKGYAWGKMGAALNRLNKPEEAAVALEKAVALLPNPAVEYNNLGIAYGKLGRYEDEINALLQAIELRPRYATARLNLAVTYLKTGNIEAAKAQHEILKELDVRAAELLMKEMNKPATSRSGTAQ